jgi:hypothetical protein
MTKLQQKMIGITALVTAVVIAIILTMTAFAKLFYPSDVLKVLDFCTGLFELVFLCTLLFFHRFWQMWAFCSCLFATWGGYSLYWAIKGLPCGCMGKLMPLPKEVALGLDTLFVAVSLFLVYNLSKKRGRLSKLLLFVIISVLGGFYFAKIVQRMAGM